MFDMTTIQKQAATAAMNGTQPSSFAHLILFTIGVFATTWFLFIIMSAFKTIGSNQFNIEEVLEKSVIASFILIFTGMLIYY